MTVIDAQVFGSRIKITRRTARLIDKVAVAATINADRQPTEDARLHITVDSPVAGTITASGPSVSEVFVFSGGVESIVGASDFPGLTDLTIDGLVGGTVYVDGENAVGEKIYLDTVPIASLPCKIYTVPPHKRIKEHIPGSIPVGDFRALCAGTYNIVDGDWVTPVSGSVGFTRGHVVAVVGIMDFSGLTHHLQIDIGIKQ